MPELPHRDVQERLDANVRTVLLTGWVAPPQGGTTEGLGSPSQRVGAAWEIAMEIERQRKRYLAEYQAELTGGG